MTRRLRGSRGFTLIELMVVIGILGILAALAISQFAKYRIRAYNAAAEGDCRNIRVVVEAYYAEYEQYPDPVVNATDVLRLTGVGGEDVFYGISSGVHANVY